MDQEEDGFTVIEVVLVLAIAGLIFAGVFIALPALWTAQRDAARKSNVSKLVSAIKTYQTNSNRGSLPTTSNFEYFTLAYARGGTPSQNTWQSLMKEYLPADFEDPKGSRDLYNIYIMKCIDASGSELATGQACKSYGGSLNFYNEINNNENPNWTPSLYVSVGATCNGNTAVKANNPRSFAVMTVLERDGKYCQSS